MLTKAIAKLIQSLKDKRSRQESGLFVVEGTKTVLELPHSKITVNSLFATREWINTFGSLWKGDVQPIEVSAQQLDQISFVKNPQGVLALAELPDFVLSTVDTRKHKVIALDGIQDPGNLGTMVRIADWYGIKHLICSIDCADAWNPKVIQATMGSFQRVEVHYTELSTWLEQQQTTIIGALMNGDNLHQVTLPETGILLIGNEGSGISDTLLPLINQPVTIPRFGGAESLNAAIATAIICDRWSS
jgi:RNA methyltransferase, TrmH family